jgi:hypothetical protein
MGNGRMENGTSIGFVHDRKIACANDGALLTKDAKPEIHPKGTFKS